LRARIAFRALIGAGLFLAWLGVLLPWEQWDADQAIGGFDASRVFWIALAVATVLATLALWRHWRWAFVALAAVALVLMAVAVLELRATVDATSPFVAVTPGAGVILSLIGSAALVSGVIVALRPPALQLAAGLAAFALVTGGAAAWPQDDGRPADGEIADAAGAAQTMAFLGDTLYATYGTRLYARPPEREYDAAGLWTPEGFDEFQTNGLAFAGDTAYVSLGQVDRLISIAPDGEHRTLVARRPDRNDPALPNGDDTEVRNDFFAGRVAAAPDGSVYVVQGDRVARWLDGRLTTLPPRFGGATDIAVDGRGAIYVADTRNGRVHRIDPNGSVRTVVGTDAPRNCVENGLDDPLSHDPRRCTGVRAIAVDRAGNLYLALLNVAQIVGVTPDGRMGVVAGTGPKGMGDGEALAARLGVVEQLAVGPDGDLYVSEMAPGRRVRRIADPAGILRTDPPEPERRTELPSTCRDIVAVSEAAAGVTDGDALERAINALADGAPDEIRDDVDLIVDDATDRQSALLAINSAMAPDEAGVSLGEYAENECRLVGGFDIPVDEANEFCVAYGRYVNRDDLVEAGDEVPPAYEDVIEAAPDLLADAGRETLRELERAAGRAVPDSGAVLAGAEAIQAVASAICLVT
jgi:hypothetical protein